MRIKPLATRSQPPNLPVLKNSLITSDLHLTSNPKDEYRWGVFDWLKDQARLNKAKSIYILGDLTDAKDNHSAVLVNRVVSHLTALAEACDVFVLRGNHDGLDPNWPYFGFLNEIPRISFVAEPCDLGSGVLALPHSRDPVSDWSEIDLSQYDVILLHGTVQGARSETGFELTGIPISIFAECGATILAGDVHVPQVLNSVYYVGSPYLVRFGDTFTPRVWAINEAGVFSDLHFETTRRVTYDLSDSDDFTSIAFVAGDQYKVRVSLSAAQATDWHKIKQTIMDLCKSHGADLASIELLRRADTGKIIKLVQGKVDSSGADIFTRYCSQKRIPQDLVVLGQNILKNTN